MLRFQGSFVPAEKSALWLAVNQKKRDKIVLWSPPTLRFYLPCVHNSRNKTQRRSRSPRGTVNKPDNPVRPASLAVFDPIIPIYDEPINIPAFDDTPPPPEIAKSHVHPSRSFLRFARLRKGIYISAQFPAGSLLAVATQAIVLSTSCKSGGTPRNSVSVQRRRTEPTTGYRVSLCSASFKPIDPRPSATRFSRSSDALLPFRVGSPASSAATTAPQRRPCIMVNETSEVGCQSGVLLPLSSDFLLTPPFRRCSRPYGVLLPRSVTTVRYVLSLSLSLLLVVSLPVASFRATRGGIPI